MAAPQGVFSVEKLGNVQKAPFPFPGVKWSRRSGPHSRCQPGAGMCLSSLGSTLQFLIPGLALFPGAPGLWQPLPHSRPRSMLLCLLLQRIPAGMGDRDAGLGDHQGVPKLGDLGFVQWDKEWIQPCFGMEEGREAPAALPIP